MVDLDFFGADNAPAPFGFDSTHFCQSSGHSVAHAVAMRYLIETIRRSYGADLQRLKENVKFIFHTQILSSLFTVQIREQKNT